MPVPAKHPLSPAQVPTLLQQAAPTLARKLSSLLQIPILVTNEDGQVIASSESNIRNRVPLSSSDSQPHQPLRIPFRIGGCCGAVTFCGDASDLEEPPGVLDAVIKQFIAQIPGSIPTPPTQPRHEPRDKFVRKLLCGSHRNEQEALELAQLWRIDLSAPISVMVFDVGDGISVEEKALFSSAGGEQLRWALQTIREIFDRFSYAGRTVCAYIGGGQIAVLLSRHPDPGAGSRDFTNKETTVMAQSALRAQITAQDAGQKGLLSHVIQVATGNYYCGVNGPSRSYREALDLLKNAHDSQVYRLRWQPGTDIGQSIVEGLSAKDYGRA